MEKGIVEKLKSIELNPSDYDALSDAEHTALMNELSLLIVLSPDELMREIKYFKLTDNGALSFIYEALSEWNNNVTVECLQFFTYEIERIFKLFLNNNLSRKSLFLLTYIDLTIYVSFIQEEKKLIDTLLFYVKNNNAVIRHTAISLVCDMIAISSNKHQYKYVVKNIEALLKDPDWRVRNYCKVELNTLFEYQFLDNLQLEQESILITHKKTGSLIMNYWMEDEQIDIEKIIKNEQSFFGKLKNLFNS